MATVQDVLDALERIAPKRHAYAFDKVGLQVGRPDKPVRRAVVSLDRSLGATRFARESSADLLLAHHPLLFRPIETVDGRTHVGATLIELIQADIAFVAAHTNWDCARGGLNDHLAHVLGLEQVREFGGGADVKQLKLVVFCPEGAAEAVIDAAAAAGAGLIGAYHRCAFLSEGTGTFEAGPDANPTVGSPGTRETVAETRVEMVLPAAARQRVGEAIRRAHPYEEPAYDFFVLADGCEQPIGRVGRLAPPASLQELVRRVERMLATKAWAWGDPDRIVESVAVVGGGADDEWQSAQAAGADVFLTGEVRQHVALEASERGMCLIAAGHYATEHPGCMHLRDTMERLIPDVDWLLYTPEPGHSGRPL